MSRMGYRKTGQDGMARRGELSFPRGTIQTPAFMPVGTYGSVKAMKPEDILATGAEIILGNTFHLYLRPGLEVIEAHRGLHDFTQWQKPILTDSGGFQVWSLAKRRKITEQGVMFASPVDGAKVFIGPEESMQIQRVLGSDIAMAFDECPPHGCSAQDARNAVDRTLRWAKECLVQPRAQGQFVFGICQGGVDPKLREKCAKELVAMEFDGYAIGGVSVGEPEPEMMKAVELAEPHLPTNKARYAMGLGTPAQMVELVARGVDMFDCVLPTRIARNGTAFTRKGTFAVKGGAVKMDFGPIEEGCTCFACQHHSRAYIRHLLNVNEILGLRLVSIHNSHLYLRVMEDIRTHLAAGTFGEFRREFIANYRPSQKVLTARQQASLAKE